ncbi:hypothetical protein [Peptostreptococcus stomatis]|uniref:hypothetical protein n=1 Tax=Peptostreptococcus stomatis TaxID=341694 RepID=UPI0024A7A9BB|nr:hypothetical protein [Peptostreptococcus stomatis]
MKLNTKKLLLQITLLIIIISLPTRLWFLNQEKRQVSSIAETFISNSYNSYFSDYDTRLIDKESKVFTYYFKKRNSIRERALRYAGYTPNTLKHISKNFNFQLVAINMNTAYVRLNEVYYVYDKTSSDSDQPGIASVDYEVVLHKRNNKWYIWSCTSHDPIINDLDREINAFLIAGWPSDTLKMRERLSIYHEYDKKNINLIDVIYNKNIKKCI